jgi:hypothetical protein
MCGPTGAIIIMDDHLAIFELFTPLSEMLHS